MTHAEALAEPRKMYHELSAEEREAYHAHVREESRKCGIGDSLETARELIAYYNRDNFDTGD